MSKRKENRIKSKQIKQFGENLKASFLYRKLNRLTANFCYQKHLKEISNLKLAVHIHLFYIDLLDEFIENLKNIPIQFDLYITLVDRPASDIQKIFEIFPNTKVFTIPNLGRDVGGLIELMREVDLSTYDALIKIHSKKSLHTGNEQKEWRQKLIGTLLGSKKQCAVMLTKFCNPKTGMVGNFEYLSFTEHTPKEPFERLCARIEIEPIEIFFRGTMFAIRPQILQRFVEKKISINDFANLDDHLEYVIEYSFGSLCLNQKYQIEALEDISFKAKKKPSKKIAKLKKLLLLQE